MPSRRDGAKVARDLLGVIDRGVRRAAESTSIPPPLRTLRAF